jgi:hypothetical protein
MLHNHKELLCARPAYIAMQSEKRLGCIVRLAHLAVQQDALVSTFKCSTFSLLKELILKQAS